MTVILTEEIRAHLLQTLRQRSGLGAPGSCQFETLTLDQVEGGEEGVVDYTYHFDQDGFSQYDKTVTLSGIARFQDGALVDFTIRLDHRGEAADYALPPPA